MSLPKAASVSAISLSRAVPKKTIPTSSKEPKTQAASRFQRIAPSRVMMTEIVNAIHTYSGVQLRCKCNELMKEQGFDEPTGQAKITPAYNLPCKFVIHTVGPIVSGRLSKRDCELLKSCYLSCLKLAEENGVESIAFCCISTGVFSFPQREAAQIAVETVKEYKEENRSDIKVIFNVFKDSDLAIYREVLASEYKI